MWVVGTGACVRFALAAAIALGGCSDDASPVPAGACLPTASISGDLRPRWDRSFASGAPGVMRLRRDGTLVLSGESGAPEVRDTPPPRVPIPLPSGQLVPPTPFVMAVGRDGEILWKRTFDWPFFAHDLDVDADGNTYLVGAAGAAATVDLGLGPITGPAFVAKLDPNGRTVFSFPVHQALLWDWGNSGMHIAAGPQGQFATFGGSGSGALLEWYHASSGLAFDHWAVDRGVGVAGPIAFDDAGGLLLTAQVGNEGGAVLSFHDVSLSTDSGPFVVYFDRDRKGVWARAFDGQTRFTALAVEGTQAFLAATFSGALAFDAATTQAEGASGIGILAVDDLGRPAPRITARAIVPAGEGDQIDALAPDGSGGVVALTSVQHHLRFGELILSPAAQAIVHLDAGGLPVAHAVLPSATTNVWGTSLVRDERGTYVFGGFMGTIDLGGDSPQAVEPGAQWPGLFLAAFGPESTVTKSVGCPPPDGALADFPRASGQIRLALAGDSIITATDTMLSAVAVTGGDPRLLAIDQSLISALATWGDRIYWTRSSTRLPEGPGELPVDARDDGSVMVLPLAGGTPTVLASGQGPARALATDGATLYWTAGGRRVRGSSVELTGTLRSVPVSGGEPAVLASGYTWVGPVALGDGFVLFAGGTTSTGGRIVRVSPAGGPAVEIAVTDRFVTSLATDGYGVFWTEATENGLTRSFWTAPAGGGPKTSFAGNRPAPRDLAVVDGRLYWAEGFTSFGPDVEVSRIKSTSVDGTGNIVDVQKDVVGPFVMDARRIAWLSVKDERWLLRVRPVYPWAGATRFTAR